LPDRFEDFFQENERSVRYALVARFGPEIGREAAADAFVLAWERWDRVSAMTNPAGYVYRVGERRARRSAVRARRIPPAETGPVDVVVAFEPRLESALAALPLRQRQVVYLVHGLELGVRESARVLGISPGSAQNHLSRALRSLRTSLGVTDV
jgi:DNA-directed RNA polymerase specialized sigma24 family protein